jgi:uncharacterized integral membrane protein
LLWAGIILAFGALLILFAPVDAKEIKFFDFPFASIEKILPAIIFLLLIILQGSLIAAAESKDRINEKLKKFKEAPLSGVYEIDENLNFVDYLAFILKRKNWGKIVEPLLYPLCVLFIAFPATWLLFHQIGITIAQGPVSGAGLLVFINLVLGFFCYMASRQFFKKRWERFRKEHAKKRKVKR